MSFAIFLRLYNAYNLLFYDKIKLLCKTIDIYSNEKRNLRSSKMATYLFYIYYYIFYFFTNNMKCTAKFTWVLMFLSTLHCVKVNYNDVKK